MKPAVEGGKPARRNLLQFFRPSIEKDEINAVVDTLKSGWLTMGPKTIDFEKAMTKYLGCKHAVAVNSCTAALHLSLLAFDVKGGEVITSPLTFAACANTIIHAGARPVFADIDEESFNIDPDEIRKKITEKTKAIMPVHYAGQPCDMDDIMEIAGEHGLRVIEDAAHAIGAEYKGRKIGTIGDATCFSFYATKNMTTGEGGLIATEDEKIADRIRTLRLHGITKDAWKRYSSEGSWYYEVEEAGWKYNMTDMQAALGLVQLKRLKNLIKTRRSQAAYYERRLKGIPEVLLPKGSQGVYHARHLYQIILLVDKLKIDRAAFISAMQAENIQTSVHFIPLHMQPFYKKTFGCKTGDFPVAENVYKGIVSLPIYPGLTKKDMDDVISAIKKIINYYRC